MGRLSMFNFMTVNGLFAGAHGDISWHVHGKDENQLAADGLQQQNLLLFGRVTYQLMASYWPTEMAQQNDPTVADGMNRAEKYVVSRSLKNAEWNNTKIISGDIGEEVRKLKQSGKNITILGSGSIVTQLSDLGLIDDYSIMINPLALGEGATLFHGLKKRLDLKLVDHKIYSSGIVLLNYTKKESR